MDKKELVSILSEILVPIGFKKKGNYWLMNCTEITKIVYLQRSQFSKLYYINYGYNINGIPSGCNIMHIDYRVYSTDKVEDLRIDKLLDFENNIPDEERIGELRKILPERLAHEVSLVNTEADVLEAIKKQMDLGIPISVDVRQYFNLPSQGMKVMGSIFDCFIKIGFDSSLNLSKEYFLNLDNTFRGYVYGESGICNTLEKLKYEDYGKDLEFVSFQFFVKPLQDDLKEIKEKYPYHKNEKAVGLPIIVNDENFFSKSEEGRCSFLKQSILQNMDLLKEIVKKKNFDTNMEKLKTDLQKILEEYPEV